jgi:hypothetical protein
MKEKESKEVRYRDHTSKLVPWIKEQIETSPDKIVRIKAEDVIDEMGPIFKKDISIYKSKKDINIRALWELKYLLWADEIVVNGAKNKDDEDLITFRKATPEDDGPISGLTEFKEDTYYFREIVVEIVTEDPFTVSDSDILDAIDNINIPEGSISTAKLGDWKIAK